MLPLIRLTVFLIICTLSSSLVYAQRNTTKVSKKDLTHLLEGIKKVEGGIFLMGQTWDYPGQYLDGDSNILYPQSAQIVQLPSFYMQSHEVTNAQYREFVHWVRDSIAHLIAGHEIEYADGRIGVDWEQELDWSPGGELESICSFRDESFGGRRELDVRLLEYQYSEYNWAKAARDFDSGTDYIKGSYKKYNRADYRIKSSTRVYPDTLVWVRDLTAPSMWKTYFSDPAYDDYPVVGVSYDQAKAYCHWKTNQIRAVSGKLGYKNDGLEFRLPTEAEWEYAALGTNLDPKAENYPVFPWSGTELMKDGKYQANFGTYAATNKGYNETEDKNMLYSSPIKSFPANNFGLYDMAGNVAEWVLDAPLPPTLEAYQIEPTIRPLKSVINWGEGKSTCFCDLEENEVRSQIIELWAAAGYDTDTTSTDYKNRIQPDIKRILRDCQSIFNIEPNELQLSMYPELKDREPFQKTKGGDWANSPYFLAASSRALYSPYTAKAWIGFRVVMTYQRGSKVQEKFIKAD
ncbi:MAG: formylglycine-generating enzyme family protein [Saprospiraceae bacterium]|nr:formylglycine-generating enzyme family protein [Saprospiraceae bacterium]